MTKSTNGGQLTAEVITIPADRLPSSRPAPAGPAEVIDLTRRDIFNVAGIRTLAAMIAPLCGHEIEVEIDRLAEEFRWKVRKRFDATESSIGGAVRAIRCGLRAEVRRRKGMT
ncbi:hypothetical protein [Mesorhizobium sp. L2C066B000]|uniref:hypothetical protein n=1 Tax=Mesorhizobium sp. L2C066B000 TaxID=1287105 RepID=UPI0003D061D0|nr:hypothetical protein [Mesorhizobium sp. L2C066B000]ESZ35091.1 hypothetical protein X732_25610 [Mesorhizobium sp. L2C066B000]